MKTDHPQLPDNAHLLLLAIGEIGDDMILTEPIATEPSSPPAQNDPPPTKSRPRRKWLAIAAALLIVAVSLPLLRGFFIRANHPADTQGGNGNDLIGDGLHYMSYEGPVMPLFGAEAYDALCVERAVSFDFSPFVKYDLAANVIDAYTLTNTSDQALTLQLYYPFSATLGQTDALMPKLTLQGETLPFTLLVGAADTMEQLRDARKTAGYLAYTALLQDGSYFAATQQEVPTIDLPITVYTITDYVIRGEGTNPTLNFTYHIDPSRTGVMTLGFNGGSNNRETGNYARHFGVPSPGEYGYGDAYYLIVVGDDLQDLQMQGYKDGGCDRGEEIDITATVTREESTIADFIRARIAEDDRKTPQYDHEGNAVRQIVSYLSDEEYFAHYMALLQTEADNICEVWNNDFRTFGGLSSQLISSERVMYLAVSVTLDAGESAELCATMYKEASVEHHGAYDEGIGFDVMTTLGSSLAFTAQTITLTGLQDLSVSLSNLPASPLPANTPLPIHGEHCYVVINRQQ